MSEKTSRFYGTGRRKTSSARVFLKTGGGSFTVNRKQSLQEYFKKEKQYQAAVSPLEVLGLQKSFDILVTVKGGGFTGQSEAIRHALARALLKVDESYRPTLKKNKFLTRDSRMVERKKYGRHKARKSTQFSKR